MVTKLRIGVVGVMALIVIHAGVTFAAATFAFLFVLGVRELSYALVGSVAFNRISMIARPSLVLLCVTAFLLLPAWSSNVARSRLEPGAPSPSMLPPLWFLGLHETLAGEWIDSLPRGELPSRIREFENDATALYRSRISVLRGLGRRAIVALGCVTVVTMMLFAWNNRRLSIAPAVSAGRGSLGIRSARFAWSLFVPRHPVAQAGFFFTLQSLSRSLPHRVSIATWLAVGIAIVTISLPGLDFHRADVSTAPLPLLAAQTTLLSMLLAGFRHAVRIPAELRAGWIFHLSWGGDERPYLAGVKGAAIAVLGVPVLLSLYALHALALGQRAALVRLIAGFLILRILLEALFLQFRKLPFVCSYVPDPRMKAVAPIYAVAFLLATYALAWIERLALASTRTTPVWLAMLIALFGGLRFLDAVQRRRRYAIEFDELPDSGTQRLNLSA